MTAVLAQDRAAGQCWASTLSGVRCTATVVPREGEGDDPIPYCGVHLKAGDGNLRVVQHGLDAAQGLLLVARRDLPAGYRMVYWGARTRCPYLYQEDRCLLFDKAGCGNNGVINPGEGALAKRGSLLQFAACPGPDERANMRGTRRYFGRRNGTLAGR